MPKHASAAAFCRRAIKAPRSKLRLVAVLATAALGAIAAAAPLATDPAKAQCGPERFDYGPTSDPFYAAIVIDHHGPGGPLLPPLAEYDRVQRDVTLIRDAWPKLVDVGHAVHFPQPPSLLVTVFSFPDLTQEIICANQYYGVEVTGPHPIGRFFKFQFPAPFNVHKMLPIYAALPGIASVEPSRFVGICDFDNWRYEQHPGDDWRWTVREERWFGFCYSVEWIIDVSAAGAVSLVSGPCDADCDDSGALDFLDFLCFQNQFAAGDLRADCDGSWSLDFFDFLCFQNDFAAGCP